MTDVTGVSSIPQDQISLWTIVPNDSISRSFQFLPSLMFILMQQFLKASIYFSGNLGSPKKHSWLCPFWSRCGLGKLVASQKPWKDKVRKEIGEVQFTVFPLFEVLCCYLLLPQEGQKRPDACFYGWIMHFFILRTCSSFWSSSLVFLPTVHIFRHLEFPQMVPHNLGKRQQEITREHIRGNINSGW